MFYTLKRGQVKRLFFIDYVEHLAAALIKKCAVSGREGWVWFVKSYFSL